MENKNKNKKNIELSDYEEIIAEKLESGGAVKFTITGNSMMPLLYDKRDSVKLLKKDSPYKKGDIIFYKRENGNYILHRIIGENADGFILCGDNQKVLEYGIKENQIFGCVAEITRKNKKIRINSLPYRIYLSFWMNTRPIRKYLLTIQHKIFKDSL